MIAAFQDAAAHPSGLNTRVVDAGNFSSFAAGRDGRGTSSPPQFGHVPARRWFAQSLQNVHSKEQMRASAESGGKSRSQHSHPGRIWSMAKPQREFCRLSLNEGKVADGESQSVDPTGPSARLIGCTIRFECSRSGSSAPSGQKPQAAYRRVAGVSPAVTPKKTRFTPTLSAQEIASLSKARPAPIPRDAGSTHIWKRWATAGSSLDNLHQIRPHASSRLNAKRTRSFPDDVAAAIRADHIASVLVASASCVLPKASGESSSARRRMSR